MLKVKHSVQYSDKIISVLILVGGIAHGYHSRRSPFNPGFETWLFLIKKYLFSALKEKKCERQLIGPPNLQQKNLLENFLSLAVLHIER